MSNTKSGTGLQEIAPEKVAQWRSEVQSFFSTSWNEVQQVIEALESEIDPVPPRPAEHPTAGSSVPASSAPAPTSDRDELPKAAKNPTPAPRYQPDAGGSAPSAPQRSSSAAPARSGSPQDARLAELARRIEERLRQSKS